MIEREFETKPVHQGYIEPHACIASWSEDGQAELFCSTQGHFIVRAHCAKLLGMDISQAAGHRVRDRRRLRRQDRGLPRAAGAGALAQVAPAGQDGDEPRGDLQGERPDLGRACLGQDRRHQGRPDHRRRGGAQVPGRRLPGQPRAAGCDVRVRPLRPRARQGGRLRRGDQPAQGRGLSRARCADLRVRGRERGRRDRQEARHRSDRVPAEECGQGRHACGLRAALRPDRPDRDARGRQGAPALQRTARAEPGARRRLRLLVQHRRRDLGLDQHQRGRHGDRGRGHARHRRLARLGLPDGGRSARRRVREGAHDHRRHQLLGLHLPHRRQSRAPSRTASRSSRRRTR